MADARWSGPARALEVLVQAFGKWSADRSPRIAAALAYYIVFSIAPLLVLAATLVGIVYSGSGRAQLLALVAQSAGPRVAEVLQQILVSATRARTGLVASAVGTATLVAGATGAFTSVQSALDQIWGVEPKPGRGLRGVIRDRMPAFLLLLVVGIILVVSLAATAVFARVSALFPQLGAVVTEALDLVLFVALMTVLFALVYKVLPDATIAWRDVWFGGLVTAVLFALGQLLIGVYLSLVSVGSLYGAAGSLIAVLVWLYYSGLVFLFGAELTQAVAARRGSPIEPSAQARRVEQRCASPQGDTGQPNERPGSAGGRTQAPQKQNAEP